MIKHYLADNIWNALKPASIKMIYVEGYVNKECNFIATKYRSSFPEVFCK